MFVVYNVFQVEKNDYDLIPLVGSREYPENKCFRSHNGENFSKDTDGSDMAES